MFYKVPSRIFAAAISIFLTLLPAPNSAASNLRTEKSRELISFPLLNNAMNGFGAAWFASVIALGLHVIDEAATDFLASYNPIARKVRARLKIPFPPTFTFWPWFLGLAAAVVILLALSPFALAGDRRVIWLAVVFGVVNIGNGLVHIGAGIRFRRHVPGLISAPLLLASGAWLLVAALRSI